MESRKYLDSLYRYAVIEVPPDESSLGVLAYFHQVISNFGGHVIPSYPMTTRPEHVGMAILVPASNLQGLLRRIQEGNPVADCVFYVHQEAIKSPKRPQGGQGVL